MYTHIARDCIPETDGEGQKMRDAFRRERKIVGG